MNAPRPLRLVVWDRTYRGWPGLSRVWAAGTHLYRGLGRTDAAFGAAGWAEAFNWLGSVEPGRPIGEIQIWSHGFFGMAVLGRDALDTSVLAPGHALGESLRRVRDRLFGPEALWWFRTCETFGGTAGHAFARAWANALDCRVAGHTHVIGVWQSGLHVLRPGEKPGWPVDEGLSSGPSGVTSRAPGLPSSPALPNTVSFLHGKIPDAISRG